MIQRATVEHEKRSSKRVLVGSAVLSALFTYLAFASIAPPFLDLLYPLAYNYTNYEILPLFVAFAGAAGVGLRWIARRYRTPAVQAGALIGALIMTGLTVWGAGTTIGHIGGAAATVPVGIVLIVAVAHLSSNPSRGDEKRTGIGLLWGVIVGPVMDLGEERSSRSELSEEASTGGDIPETSSPSDWRRVLSVSKYWRAVGAAFAVCIPIAVNNPELGIGLLSTFLTAYGLSHQIEGESEGSEDGE